MKKLDYLINAKPVATKNDLAADANAATIVTAFNDLMARMRTAGLMQPICSITYDLSHATQTSQPTTATGDADVSITVAAAANYALPDAVDVLCGAYPLEAGTDYTWTKASGVIAIEKEAITDDLTIVVAAVAS